MANRCLVSRNHRTRRTTPALSSSFHCPNIYGWAYSQPFGIPAQRMAYHQVLFLYRVTHYESRALIKSSPVPCSRIWTTTAYERYDSTQRPCHLQYEMVFLSHLRLRRSMGVHLETGHGVSKSDWPRQKLQWCVSRECRQQDHLDRLVSLSRRFPVFAQALFPHGF
ncbi:hypothetical protein CPB84DRAFT_239712 [Gymnopilus junonius]|uniref:Uncharacterized protein n=1 Tax=Gymnopilus junonius TaxID=109634 RepID=A0A9P5TRP9_GYMJU|nr:hypothetical protein CPB84DRAFT_239712 [Gymnopilus junonius]